MQLTRQNNHTPDRPPVSANEAQPSRSGIKKTHIICKPLFGTPLQRFEAFLNRVPVATTHGPLPAVLRITKHHQTHPHSFEPDDSKLPTQPTHHDAGTVGVPL